MRVAGVPRAPAELEGDALLRADRAQPLEHHADALRAELGGVVFLLVDARGGRVRVEVEGGPARGEGVGCVGGVEGAVLRDGFLEAPFADVALGRSE